MFDKMSPDTYKLVEDKTNPTIARLLFLVFLLAAFCAGFAVIGVSVKWVALNAFLPLVTAITSRYTPSQVGTVGMSIGLAVVALAGAFAVVSRLIRKVRLEVLYLIAPTIARTEERLTRLESRSADRESVQSAVRELETRIVVIEPVPPEVKTKADMERHALLKLLGTTSVAHVGPLPESEFARPDDDDEAD